MSEKNDPRRKIILSEHKTKIIDMRLKPTTKPVMTLKKQEEAEAFQPCGINPESFGRGVEPDRRTTIRRAGSGH